MHTPFTFFFFFFNDTATTEIYTLSLHDALPILLVHLYRRRHPGAVGAQHLERHAVEREPVAGARRDRKSTRLNSSHGYISYAVFCLKKKKQKLKPTIQHQRTSILTQSTDCAMRA